jgi:hypothetical protein
MFLEVRKSRDMIKAFLQHVPGNIELMLRQAFARR